MRKKGFTLIETIITLFVIVILFSGAASVGSFESKIYKDIESDGFLYEIHDFLTYAKLKSKFENKPGKLIVVPVENKIYYTNDNSEIIKSLSVPNSMKITSRGMAIPIDASGRINKSDSIEFQNYFNELKSIKIRVGIDYINLNDD